MTSIELAVNGQVACAVVDGLLTAGTVGIPIILYWDEDWEPLTKTLVCQSGAGKRLVFQVTEEATLPPEVLQTVPFGSNELYLGLEGRDPEGTLVMTSTMAYAGKILPGAIADGDPTVAPQSPGWVNVIASLDAVSQRVSEVEERLESGSPSQAGFPSGGTQGQILAKRSDSSQDVQWVDPPEDGTSVTVTSVTESTADGGSNVVKFSDGKSVTIKNGSKGSTGPAGPAGAAGSQGPRGETGAAGADGKTPVKGTDYWTEDDKQEILDEDIIYLSQELAKRQQLTPEYANDISGCTDTSKLYVLPDGFIYAYILGESTGTKTETVTPVWQMGVKLDKSTGAESSGGNYTACEPIYIADGETYVFSVANNYYLNGVACWYGSSGNYLGYTEAIASASSPGAAASATLKPLSGAAYFRLRLYHIWGASSDSSSIQAQLNKATMTKTVPETSGAYGWNSTGHAFVPADYEGRIVSLETMVNALKGDMSIFGIVDAAKQITLTGALETGTYTIQYQDAEGKTVDIGTFQIGG